MYQDSSVKRAAKSESISWQSIPPAVWARLPSDADSPVRQFLEKPPDLIPLNATSSCCCKPTGSRSFFNPTESTKVIDCAVYGISKMWRMSIEIQKCPACKHRYIGPDCREIGIFNWNNRCLFMHDLLEDYTCSYTTSETPIHSWVLTVSRRYQSHGAEFVGEKRFSAVWFAYARILELANDMKCLKCGPEPRVTIWDGVTLAFTRKNILPSLRPPTHIHNNAPRRSTTRYPLNPQCIPDKEVRKSIQFILEGPSLDRTMHLLPENTAEGLAAPSDSTASRQNSEQAMRARLDAIPSATRKLGAVNPSLGRLFDRSFGVESAGGLSVLSVYRRFFRQLAAEESVLQLMTRPVLHNMETFLLDPGTGTLPLLTMFPALYNIIQHELHTDIHIDTLGVCKWLLIRGWTVLLGLISED
ncbi:hypothetical protein GALMADRAFT_131208, partial [Galerina marginata CBS 339.88]